MINKILVPLDGSDLAKQALPYAIELAMQFEAELILVRALQLVPQLAYTHHPGYPFGEQYQWPSNDDDSESNISRMYLQGVQETLPIRSKIEVLSSYPPADAIVDYAKVEGVDLIVMSTHGRSGVSRWVFGSVANKVLQESPCPVYLVRVKG